MERSPVESQSVDWFLYDRNLRHERVNIRHYAHDTIQLKYVRDNRAGIYLLKVNNRNSRTRCEIYSKLTTKSQE